MLNAGLFKMRISNAFAQSCNIVKFRTVDYLSRHKPARLCKHGLAVKHGRQAAFEVGVAGVHDNSSLEKGHSCHEMDACLKRKEYHARTSERICGEKQFKNNTSM